MRNELVTFSNPKSSISENIRTIRTNLQFAAVDEDLQTILVTSSISEEGKSFISSNLAVAFAQIDKKVLLMDCDIRRGRLHHVFKIKANKGLSNLLIDDIKNVAEYIVPTSIDNLYLLPRGTVAPNPSELLESENMYNLIEKLKKSFDYIIFDGVPVIGLSDSLIMARLVDKVIIVTAVDYTPVELLVNTKKNLENVKADIAGVVVNRVKGQKSSYYSKYYE